MSMKVLIVGGVALGPKVACRVKRLLPDATVVMIDQGELISYGGCGIPYYISGDISSVDELRSTNFHMIRDPQFFRDCKGVDVFTNTRAISIDREKKTVKAVNLKSNNELEFPYDKLVIATGSKPRKLPVAGSDLSGIYAISDLNMAIVIREEIASGKVEKATIIGAGAIGLELAEAMSDMWGIETSVVEVMDQILPGILSFDMARMAQKHMEDKGVKFYLKEKVVGFEGSSRVQKVITDKRVIESDLVVVAIGVHPNSYLAKSAGLKLTSFGGIEVNEYMQTSDPDIYAGGDCVAIKNLVTDKPGYFPLGSLSNRQGRVIGTNIAGGKSTFEGAIGSFAIKLFDIAVVSAGLSLSRARQEGFDAISALVAQQDRAHFYPEKKLMFLELVVERATKRVLGIQGLGESKDAVMGRVSSTCGIIKQKGTVMDLSNFEVPYTPPLSSAMDILNTVANVAENIMDGLAQVIDISTFVKFWDNRMEEHVLFVDCREWPNAREYVEKYKGLWKNIPQGQIKDRIEEIPKDKKVILLCNTGARSYEAQLFLKHKGFKNVFSLMGGVAGLKHWGVDI